jgi:hypothetical protein
MVQGQDREGQVAQWAAREAVPVRLDEGFGQLDFALATATAEDHRVAILDASHGLAVIVHQDNRLEGVVGLSLEVQIPHGLRQDQAARF